MIYFVGPQESCDERGYDDEEEESVMMFMIIFSFRSLCFNSDIPEQNKVLTYGILFWISPKVIIIFCFSLLSTSPIAGSL